MYFQYFQSLSIAPPWNPWNPSSISASFLSWGAQTGHNIPDAISQVLSRRKNSCNTMQNVVVFFCMAYFTRTTMTFSANMLSVLLAPSLYCCMVHYSTPDDKT